MHLLHLNLPSSLHLYTERSSIVYRAVWSRTLHMVTGCMAMLEPHLWVQGLSPHTCASSEDIHFQDLAVSSKHKDNKPSLKNESILRIRKGFARSRDFFCYQNILFFGPWNYDLIVFIK